MNNKLTKAQAFEAFIKKSPKTKTFYVVNNYHGYGIFVKGEDFSAYSTIQAPQNITDKNSSVKNQKLNTFYNKYRLENIMNTREYINNEYDILGTEDTEKVLVDFRTSGKNITKVVTFYDNNTSDSDQITILVNDPKKVKTYQTVDNNKNYTVVQDLVSQSLVKIRMIPDLKFGNKLKQYNKTANYEIMGEAGFSKAYLVGK